MADQPPDVEAVDLPAPRSSGRSSELAIVAQSDSLKRLFKLAEHAAASNTKVLITGETGVGKDVLARFIHNQSERASGRFVAVNCAGVAETLLESELFGHEKGSFTGAYRTKIGQLQIANNGTLFLDEVGEMSLRMQALLLRFLETGEIQPVGADHTRVVPNVRIIAATNRDLQERVASGDFREDVLYRLRVIHLHVPPLRERREDIQPLIDLFLRKSRRPVVVTEQARAALEKYRWPGNVRELQNIVEQMLWQARDGVIDLDQVPEPIRTFDGIRPGGRERRRQVADELYDAVVNKGYSFWEHIYPLFLGRDITRYDMRELVRRGLTTARGNYRVLLQLFRIPARDYKRFLNFLAAHDCRVEYRAFRNGTSHQPQRYHFAMPALTDHGDGDKPPVGSDAAADEPAAHVAAPRH